MGGVGKCPRAAVFAVYLEGHWAPILQLLRQLVDHEIQFTVFSSQRRVDELERCRLSGQFGKLDVELKVFFRHEQESANSGLILKQGLMEFEQQRAQLVDARFTCVIADMFLGFTQDLADDLGVPKYTLCTSPAYFSLGMLNAPNLIDCGWHPDNEEKKNQYVDIPGLHIFTAGDIPRTFLEHLEAYRVHASALSKGAGILINSVEEYEPEILEILRRQLKRINESTGKVTKVYPIGPLFLLPSLSPTQRASAVDSEANDECIKFLDDRPKLSVLFICFGSMRPLPESTVREIARALDASQVPFLWGLRLEPGHSAEETLPPGFQARTKARGLVITRWIPQKEVLKHPSTAAFLSHCGWNSFLESTLSGVPVIAWPMWAEQHLNARFSSDALKVSVKLKGHGDAELDGDTIANTVRSVMTGEAGEQMRQRIAELRKAAEAAVEKLGSSQRNIQAFVDDLRSYASAAACESTEG